jgi:hypothetical protein
MGFHPSRSGFPASSSRAFPGTIQVWSYRLSTGVCLPAGPAVGAQSWSRHTPWLSACGTAEREEYIGQHARAFTQASDLAWNPQTRFSCQSTVQSIPQTRTFVQVEGGAVSSQSPEGDGCPPPRFYEAPGQQQHRCPIQLPGDE